MTTISVPLPAHLEEFVNEMVQKHSSNKAAIVRTALERLAEEEAVQAVLIAQQEVTEGKVLRGDLDTLLADD